MLGLGGLLFPAPGSPRARSDTDPWPRGPRPGADLPSRQLAAAALWPTDLDGSWGASSLSRGPSRVHSLPLSPAEPQSPSLDPCTGPQLRRPVMGEAPPVPTLHLLRPGEAPGGGPLLRTRRPDTSVSHVPPRTPGWGSLQAGELSPPSPAPGAPRREGAPPGPIAPSASVLRVPPLGPPPSGTLGSSTQASLGHVGGRSGTHLVPRESQDAYPETEPVCLRTPWWSGCP